jgi:hypothetical protein
MEGRGSPTTGVALVNSTAVARRRGHRRRTLKGEGPVEDAKLLKLLAWLEEDGGSQSTVSSSRKKRWLGKSVAQLQGSSA